MILISRHVPDLKEMQRTGMQRCFLPMQQSERPPRYLQWTQWRLSAALRAVSIRAKLRLLFCVILVSVPRMLRTRLPQWVNATAEDIANKLAEYIVVQVSDVKYVLVDAESLTIVSPLYESSIMTQLKVKPRETFLDVGANIGKYSFQIASKVSKSLVISVEAHPKNYQALKKGIQLNGFRNVIPVNVAAWKENREMKLYIGKRAGTHTVKGNLGLGHIRIKAETLDCVLKRLNVTRVDWIKIDVEGASLEVLEGLSANLQSHPNLIVEAFDFEDVISFLRHHGYVERRLSSGNFLFAHA